MRPEENIAELLQSLDELNSLEASVDSMDVATLLGGDAIAPAVARRSVDAVNLADAIQAASADTSPRFISPLAPNSSLSGARSAQPLASAPLLLFLPGECRNRVHSLQT